MQEIRDKQLKGDCSDAADAAVLPAGYTQTARLIADRRMILSGYRLADLLHRDRQLGAPPDSKSIFLRLQRLFPANHVSPL